MGNVVRFRRRRSSGHAVDKRWLLLAGATGLMGFATVGAFVGSPVSLGFTKVQDVSAPFQPCINASQHTCVVDGDTIRYRGEKIRLADVNTPETYKAECHAEAALGKRATQLLIGWLNLGAFEIRSVMFRDRDVYGRQLRILERGGKSVGDHLIAHGVAERWMGSRRNWCV